MQCLRRFVPDITVRDLDPVIIRKKKE